MKPIASEYHITDGQQHGIWRSWATAMHSSSIRTERKTPPPVAALPHVSPICIVVEINRKKMPTWTLIQKSCQLLLHYGKNCLCISVKRSHFFFVLSTSHPPLASSLKPQTNHTCVKGQQGMRNDCKTSRRKAEPSIILTQVDKFFLHIIASNSLPNIMLL